MRSPKKRFRIFSDKNPNLSSLIVYGRAVEFQRYTRFEIAKYFKELVDKEDYARKDTEAIIDHLMKLSHSKNNDNTTENMAKNGGSEK